MITEVAIVALAHRAHYLARPRPGRDPGLAGTWEFPGGHLESGETPLAAAVRELREETGLEGIELAPLRTLEHSYPDRRLRLHFFRGVLPATVHELPATQKLKAPPTTWEWLRLSALEDKMPAANAAVLAQLGELTADSEH